MVSSYSNMTEDEDQDGEEKKNLSKFLSMLGKLIKGKGLSPTEIIVGSMKPDTQSDFKKIDKLMDKRLNTLIQTCLNQGCTMGGVSRDSITTDAFVMDRGCDSHTTFLGGTVTDVCFLAAVDKMRFSKESDGELYTENQLRPEGMNPSIIVRLWPVFQENDLPELPTSLEDVAKIEDVRPYLCSAIATEFYTILDKHREEGDHFHFDMQLDQRILFDRDFMLSKKSFHIPQLNMGGTNFMDTLEFMDENPESGG